MPGQMVSILLFKQWHSEGRIGRETSTRPIFNLPFEFQKRSQLFIRTHNVTLAIVAMSVNNEDRSPVGINR
jgi:hypothetical protein